MKRFPILNPAFTPKLLIAFTLTFALSGCSYFKPYKSEVTQGNIITEESLSLLQEGLSKDQVRALFGPPMAGENPFNPNHWEYVFYNWRGENHSEVKEHLVINFDQEGFVNRWETKATQIKLKERDSLFGLNIF